MKTQQPTDLPDRRRFLVLGATAGISALAFACGEAVEAQAAGQPLVAMPLPDKIYSTERVGISRKTHDEHYQLYLGYVKKVNEIRGKLKTLGVPDPKAANATFSDIRELKVEYSFALGGVKNHEIYFGHLGGKGGDPVGPVADVINATFGSFANWKADLKATGIAARGWVWLAHDPSDGSFFNYIGDSQNTFPIWGATPILALDVYEHAYFIDFGRDRSKYIDAIFAVIDWDAVNANLKVAQAVAAAVKGAR
jgi:Fe-Mn family superoxide dismutase